MSVTSGVSFLAQHQSQISRLNDLRVTMEDLHRQVATGKKFDSMRGFGLEARRVLQLRADRDQAGVFSYNIDTAVTRINIMDESLTAISSSTRQMIQGLFLRPQGAVNDVASINVQAQQLLEYVSDLTNVSIDGRYLFAGTDTTNVPHADLNLIENNVQAEVDDWLTGVTTTAQFLANIDGFTNTDLGFSASLASAQPASVRVSKSTELTYGVLADQSGIQNAVRALTLLSRIQQPDPLVDTPTNAEYEQVMSHVLNMAQGAAEDLDAAQTQLSGRLQLVTSIQETHQKDLSLFSSILDEMENTDMADAVTRLQSVQTRLQASYETTRIVNQMSLVNFL